MLKRKLTLSLQRTVGSTSDKPEIAEVVLVPLQDPSSSQDNVTLAGGRQVKKVELTQAVNDIVFELIPSNASGLSEEIWYRIGWRTQFLGSVKTTDFKMPDFDVNYADLEELDAIIDGRTYLQHTDLNQIVASLDDDGDVVNAFGVKITGTGDATAVSNRLDNEILARQQGDNAVRNALEAELITQIQATLATAHSEIILAVGELENADLVERQARINAVNALNSALSALETSTNQELQELIALTESHATTLLGKADLVNGKIPTSQIPAIAVGTAVPVANQAEMLALTSTQVQPGDFAVRPDGTWLLLSEPASQLSNWIKTSTGGDVLSVNGMTGTVVLSAANVGARSASTPVPAADVAGLTTFQTNTTTSLTGHNTRISAIENDALIVRLNINGVVAATVLPNTVAFVNESGQLVTKSGDPIIVEGSGAVDSVNGQTGVVVLTAADVSARSSSDPIPAADIVGLETVLENVVEEGDPRLTNTRDPNPHRASHASSGSDPITPGDIGARPLSVDITIPEVTNLQPTLTNHANRINALESGSPGGGGGADTKAIRFDNFEETSDFDQVALDSPFGYNPLHENANAAGFYYDPTGAADGEGAYAHVHKTGYLEVRRRIIGASPDPDYATQDDLDALTTQVSSKASITALNTLSDTVDDKADQTDLVALQSAVSTKAESSALTETNAALALKADQTALDTTNATVALKANQSSLDATNATVATKAGTGDLTAATIRVTALESALPNKADLVSGRVPLSQTATNIPKSSIVDLVSNLAAKADLVGGKIPTSQISAISTSETLAVTSKAAMLALTSAQVQSGDTVYITATVDKGGYTLMGADPSVFGNWLKHIYPDGVVASVNGQTGIVVLTASDVGARSSVDSISQNDVTGLTATLASKANASDLAAKTSTSDVTNLISNAANNKLLVDRVATTNVVSLSNTQSIDGSLVPLGSKVLLTAQVSSIQNGIYTVNTGAWTRVADMDTGQQFVRGTIVPISSGSSYANTFWQQTAVSGIVGTSVNNWTLVMRAGPPNSYDANNGVKRSGTTFQFDPVPGGGLTTSALGAAIDTSIIPKKFVQNVPAGSNPVTITHNLGTLDVDVTVRDVASGTIVLVPIVVTGPNTVSLSFASTPANGQWRVRVDG